MTETLSYRSLDLQNVQYHALGKKQAQRILDQHNHNCFPLFFQIFVQSIAVSSFH